jgi:hypothetical protein
MEGNGEIVFYIYEIPCWRLEGIGDWEFNMYCDTNIIVIVVLNDPL